MTWRRLAGPFALLACCATVAACGTTDDSSSDKGTDAAFEKQTFQPELFLDLNFSVLTISGSIICVHGLDASPSGVTERWASWRS